LTSEEAELGDLIGATSSQVSHYEGGRAQPSVKTIQPLAAALDSPNPIRVKLITEKRTERPPGGQIVGREGSAKRIGALATAIWNEMSVDEVLGPGPVLRLTLRPGVGPRAHRGAQSVRGRRGRAALPDSRNCLNRTPAAASEKNRVLSRRAGSSGKARPSGCGRCSMAARVPVAPS